MGFVMFLAVAAATISTLWDLRMFHRLKKWLID